MHEPDTSAALEGESATTHQTSGSADSLEREHPDLVSAVDEWDEQLREARDDLSSMSRDERRALRRAFSKSRSTPAYLTVTAWAGLPLVLLFGLLFRWYRVGPFIILAEVIFLLWTHAIMSLWKRMEKR